MPCKYSFLDKKTCMRPMGAGIFNLVFFHYDDIKCKFAEICGL